MKALLARLRAEVGRLIPRNLIATIWRKRGAILTWIILAIGTTWMVCGALYQTPGAVMFGFILVGAVGLDAGYQFGARMQAAVLARMPKPSEKKDEDEKPRKGPPPKAPAAKPAKA